MLLLFKISTKEEQLLICSCCYKDKDDAHTYKLPSIGYGSVFDTFGDEYIVKFNLCSECANKINRWIKKKYPNIPLDDFWGCEIQKTEYIKLDSDNEIICIERYKYEKLLYKLFKKFMPQVIN